MFESLSSFVEGLPVIGNIFDFITSVFEASQDLVKGIFSGSSEGSSFDGSSLDGSSNGDAGNAGDDADAGADA